MNKPFRAMMLVLLLVEACSAPPEPQITPPQPSFMDAGKITDPVDHRIYADVGPQNAIVIEWKADTSGNTSGYVLYRSINDSTVDADGLLAHRTTVAQLESSNQLIEPLATSFKDTTGIVAGATYWYQLQAFYRSPSNNLHYSKPTPVDITTSFTYFDRDQPLFPSAGQVVNLNGSPLQFRWLDPDNGGRFHLIVQRLDNQQFVWDSVLSDFQSTITMEYPLTATPLEQGVPYQWRVKRVAPYGGSTSPWSMFSITP